MASSKKRRASTPPSAATTCPSSSTNAAQTASPSLPYFLPELIPFIASRLTTLQDFFALRAACRTYRDLLPPSPANLASQGPLLLFRRLSSASGALFHVPLRRILRFRLPPTEPSGLTEFYSFGCRVAIQDRDGHDIDARRELRIHHLLTGERARLPDSLEPRYSEEGVVFSGDLVVTFRKQCRVLYYCHIGDLHWREARCDKGHLLYDLMFVKGTLYALIYNHPHYRLAVVELDKSSVVLSFLGDKLSVPEDNCPRFWLAECRGELLLIVRVRFNPWVYHVFRLQSGEGKWARTTSLGGCSLFFNWHEFAGCLGPDHPAVQRDCLYFTGYSGKWSEYSLVDGSYHEFVIDHPGRTEDYGSPVWVLSSIC
uniref:Predicted protein n=1 Tax=Hordeum vulgare subsp. vulgare TaxID=112509 RepID=F2EK94_HORVV|nr:predicted protein [Hordeum vulgare subsp. vulgare]